jgi:peptidyl-prolyl cis-trans isomerase D
MLQAIRDKAQGWIAWAIVILISIPFALWGINEYLGVGGDPVIAEVDGVEITQRELDSSIQRYRYTLRDRLGAAYDPDMFPDSMVRQQVLDSMIRDLVIARSAADLGLRAGDAMLRANIRQVPAFQSGGRFDPQAYESALRVQGFTPATFEQRLRDELAVTLLESGVTGGALVTDREVRDFLSLRDQTRDVAYVVVPAERFAVGTEPDEAEIQAYYEENSARFVRPERVKLAFIELSREQLAESLPVDEEALLTYYETHGSAFIAPEQRRVRHILLTPDGSGDDADAAALARAEELLDKLRAGEDFAELAQAHSADPGSGAAGGDLGLVGRGVMVDAFEEVAFSLEPGVVSDPVKTEFGYHLIEVTEVMPEQVQEFDEARDRVMRAWRQEEAERRFYDLAERLADLAFENPGSLDVAAEALDLPVQESDWIVATGGAGGVLDTPKVLAAAFSEEVLERGNNSDTIELDATHVLVLRSLAHEVAAPKPLDEVRDEIVEAIAQQNETAAAEQFAGELLSAVKDGQSLADAAAGHDLEVMTLTDLGRAGGEGVPPALVNAVFTAGLPGEAGSLPGSVALGLGDRAVFVLQDVTNADVSALSGEELEATRAQLASRRAQRELALFVAQQRAETAVNLKQPVASE